jgi:undecaprenyl-diphosphatase
VTAIFARRRETAKLPPQITMTLSHRRHERRTQRGGHSAVIDFLAGLDVSIFRTLNDFCGSNGTLDRLAVHLEVIRSSLFMGILGWLWYWPGKEMPRRRETLITMLLAVVLALAINRGLSTLLPFRDRPMYGIGANAPTFEWRADLEHWSSFPSDTATYLFAVATSFWLISRWWGLGFAVFGSFGVLARVYLGLHYPSDILVGALIGIITSLAVNREPVRKLIAAPILAFEPRYPAYFYGVFFIVLAELSEGFPNARRLAVAIVHFLAGYTR